MAGWTVRGIWFGVILVALPGLWLTGSLVAAQDLPSKEIQMDGKIILGGLFPIHEKGADGKMCGPVKEEKGIQRVEAMMFAIDQINDDQSILPNITLGAKILDTCLRDTYALEQSLEFIKAHMSTMDAVKYKCSDGSEPVARDRHPVAGVIGAAASPVSIMVANMLRLFKIPQISYASTGIELSDKTRFGYFSRVVPPDTYQAQAMVDIVRHFGWTYVSTVADEGNYGEKGISTFRRLAEKSGICTAATLQIPRETKTDTFEKLLRGLLQFREARVVVLFVNEDNCRQLVNATKYISGSRSFTWLASDSWGAKRRPVDGQDALAEGTVTVLPQRAVLTEFDDYFQKLTPQTNTRNPWFHEFWEKHFRCSFTSRYPRRCTGFERISRIESNYMQEGIVPFVVDGVYAMAHALNNMMADTCGSHARMCDAMKPPEGSVLLSYIRNVSFIGAEKLSADDHHFVQEGLVPFVVDAVYAMAYALHGMQRHLCDKEPVCEAMIPLAGPELLRRIRDVDFIGVSGHRVRFNKDGDAMGRYTIYQYQKVARETYDYVPIGNWSNSLQLDTTLTRWRGPLGWTSHVPNSVCSEPCMTGYVRTTADPCCWGCRRCTQYEVMLDEYNCLECANGSIPDANRTSCVDIEVEPLTISSPWAIVPIVFALLGLLATLFVIVIFIRFNDTPVIKASGRELCYVLLVGIVCCYLMTFVLVAKPSKATCGLLRLGLGLSLSLCYAALFTKTNRISRIFNRGVKAMVKRPSYTSPRSQLIICFCLVSVQVIAAITWLGMDFPDTKIVFPDRETALLRCRTTNVAIVLSLLYNMILILMCTVYALKTRKIPENFNEAKYIAFTMYSTCIVWLAFIPIFIGTNKNDLKIQTTALCMCVAISATVALGCLFVPKVYIVLFQPHKNVRQGSKGAPGAGGRPFFGRQSSRFSSLAAMNGDITSPSNRPSSSEQTCPASPTSVSITTGGDLFDPDLYLSGYSDSDCDRNNLPLTQTAAM